MIIRILINGYLELIGRSQDVRRTNKDFQAPKLAPQLFVCFLPPETPVERKKILGLNIHDDAD